MEQKRVIYIVLSMSGTKFARFLNIFLHSEFVHVSLSLEKDLSTLYSFGRKKMHRPWHAGFVEETMDTGVFGKYNPWCEVLELEISDAAYIVIDDKIKYVKRHSKEYKYNFSGLVYTYFKIPKDLQRSFTCTQFVATLLDSAGILEIDKPTSLVLPKDYLTLNVKSIYKGRMHDYKKDLL